MNLIKIYRTYRQRIYPSLLGEKNFEKVIAAYDKGGFSAVEELMSSVLISPVVQAHGYTALARQLMNSDRINAAYAARHAYLLDPKPYRLKWLAFRLYEAGSIIEAEAILNILPSDTYLSKSEIQRAKLLREEADHINQREIKQKIGYSERCIEQKKRVMCLIQECDEAKRLAASQAELITTLKNQIKPTS
jgi:hypothetical protein